MYSITTFSGVGYDIYGRAFLESYLKYWDIPIHAYYEGDTQPGLQHEKIIYHSLDDIEERADFLKVDTPKPPSYAWNAKRFCHKAFAQIDALQSNRNKRAFWIDADVTCTKHVPEQWLKELFIQPRTNPVALVYLGRWTNHSECGFVGFDPQHPMFELFLERYKQLYHGQAVFQLQAGWTDCHAFDAARQGIPARDLTPWGRGVDHVWQASPLQDYMTHHKGPQRKRAAYGKPIRADLRPVR